MPISISPATVGASVETKEIEDGAITDPKVNENADIKVSKIGWGDLTRVRVTRAEGNQSWGIGESKYLKLTNFLEDRLSEITQADALVFTPKNDGIYLISLTLVMIQITTPGYANLFLQLGEGDPVNVGGCRFDEYVRGRSWSMLREMGAGGINRFYISSIDGDLMIRPLCFLGIFRVL